MLSEHKQPRWEGGRGPALADILTVTVCGVATAGRPRAWKTEAQVWFGAGRPRGRGGGGQADGACAIVWWGGCGRRGRGKPRSWVLPRLGRLQARLGLIPKVHLEWWEWSAPRSLWNPGFVCHLLRGPSLEQRPRAEQRQVARAIGTSRQKHGRGGQGPGLTGTNGQA